MEDSIYKTLASHLDQLPGGFPPTANGLELRILRQLFTPEQAALAVHLSLLPEFVQVIASRAGLSPEQTLRLLDKMAASGLILDIQRKGRPPRYMAAQFVVGIWEYQVSRLTPQLARDVEQYLADAFAPELWQKAPQLRTIPIGASLSTPAEVMLYESAEHLLEAHTRFAVAPCICRQEQALLGDGCDKPLETCLLMGTAADLYIRHQRGREISREEALAILRLANQSGLVLQPGNSQNANNICCCCGDCCGVLRIAKRHLQPASVISSAFYAQCDPDLCNLCLTCEDRCQMEAIHTDSGYVVVDLNRCIGCGLCVPTCSMDAMQLIRKPESLQPVVPLNDLENMTQNALRRGLPSPIEAARQRARNS